MIRLSTTSNNGTTLVRMDGRLDAHTVDQVRRSLDAISNQARTVLDVAGLTSMDALGRDLLRDLRSRGCTIAGGSLYIKTMLEETRP